MNNNPWMIWWLLALSACTAGVATWLSITRTRSTIVVDQIHSQDQPPADPRKRDGQWIH